MEDFHLAWLQSRLVIRFESRCRFRSVRVLIQPCLHCTNVGHLGILISTYSDWIYYIEFDKLRVPQQYSRYAECRKFTVGMLSVVLRALKVYTTFTFHLSISIENRVTHRYLVVIRMPIRIQHTGVVVPYDRRLLAQMV